MPESVANTLDEVIGFVMAHPSLFVAGMLLGLMVATVMIMLWSAGKPKYVQPQHQWVLGPPPEPRYWHPHTPKRRLRQARKQG